MAGGPNSSTASSPSAAGDPLKPASSSPPSSLGSQPTTAGKPSIGTKITPSGTAIPNVPGQQKTINNLSPPYGKSPIHDLGPFDNDMSAMQGLPDPGPVNGHPMSEGSVSILMRRLPRNATQEALRSMFLFAKDFIDADFITPDAPEDKGFISAVARFRTSTAAEDAKALLDGKPNFANEANMIVEVMESPLNGGYWTRRKTFDGAVHRGMPGPTFGGPGARQSSRFNGTFQSMERVSPPTLSKSLNSAGTDLPAPEAGGHFQSLFSPKSQINYAVGEQRRVTGKSVINDDTIDDDETGELLKDPVAYAKNGHGNSGLARRPTNPSVPVSRFAGLSLATNPISSPPKQSYAAPRGSVSVQSPSGSMPPGSMNVGPGSNYQLASQHYQRHNYPPVNPADQNPPCNTLYVGNLPMDTSEDELKAMFSKQRGYKRLCFRTKQNGPMCFVEFEDISFATKALNELYGHPLHNSVKGGIRLSFSKNPLGVRTGQPGSSSNPSIPLSPQNTFAGINGGLGGLPGQPFSSVNGPPPGLTAPPGLNGSVGQTSGSNSGLTSPIGNPMMGGFRGADFGLNSVSLAGLRGQPVAGGVPTSSANSGMTMGSAFPDYMMGR